MKPEQRPKQSIVLVNRSSTALYSGMVPGLIAGLYQRDELAIDLRQLCDRAGVAFVEAEITGLDPQDKCLRLRNRPALHFDWLSLDVGAISRPSATGIPIKPLEASLAFLESEDPSDPKPLRVIGAGAAGLEVVLALRRRWPQRPLQLQQRSGQLDPAIQQVLQRARITLIDDDSDHQRTQPALHRKPGPGLAGDDRSAAGSRWPDPHRSLPEGGRTSIPVRQRRLCRDQRRTPASIWGVGGACRTALGHQFGSSLPGPTTEPMATTTTGTATDRKP